MSQENITPSPIPDQQPASTPAIPGHAERDYGHGAETIVADIFRGLPTVKEVQHATANEDGNGTDIWVFIHEWEPPIGVQLSISDNFERIAEKKSRYPMRTQKEDMKNLLTYTVLVTGKKSDFAESDRKFQVMRANRPGAQAHETVPDKVAANLYYQLVTRYTEALPNDRMKKSFQETLQRNSIKKA